MAVIVGIVEEALRREGLLPHVDCPVHEGGCTTDGEDDGVFVVKGHGFEGHCFGAHEPVALYMIILLASCWFGVDAQRVSRCEVEKRPSVEVELDGREVGWKSRIAIFPDFGEVVRLCRALRRC